MIIVSDGYSSSDLQAVGLIFGIVAALVTCIALVLGGALNFFNTAKKELSEVSVSIETNIGKMLDLKLEEKFRAQNNLTDEKFRAQNNMIDEKFRAQNNMIDEKFHVQNNMFDQKIDNKFRAQSREQTKLVRKLQKALSDRKDDDDDDSM